jgi:hypothetical protein
MFFLCRHSAMKIGGFSTQGQRKILFFTLRSSVSSDRSERAVILYAAIQVINLNVKVLSSTTELTEKLSPPPLDFLI